jgi:hypothetical protein
MLLYVGTGLATNRPLTGVVLKESKKKRNCSEITGKNAAKILREHVNKRGCLVFTVQKMGDILFGLYPGLNKYT